MNAQTATTTATANVEIYDVQNDFAVFPYTTPQQNVKKYYAWVGVCSADENGNEKRDYLQVVNNEEFSTKRISVGDVLYWGYKRKSKSYPDACEYAVIIALNEDEIKVKTATTWRKARKISDEITGALTTE